MASYKHLSTSYQLFIIIEVKFSLNFIRLLTKVVKNYGMKNILPLKSTLQPSITLLCTHNVCQQQLLKLKHDQS